MTVSPIVAASARASGCDGPPRLRPVMKTVTSATPAIPVMIHGTADGRRPTAAFLLVAMRDPRGRGLQRPELGQDLRAVEKADVLGLHRRELPHGPREVDEMRLEGMPQRRHAAFFRQRIALPRVARRTRRDHVGPLI